eukprot:gene11932-13219_t
MTRTFTWDPGPSPIAPTSGGQAAAVSGRLPLNDNDNDNYNEGKALQRGPADAR